MVPSQLRQPWEQESGSDAAPRAAPDANASDPFLEFAAEVRATARNAPPAVVEKSFWTRYRDGLMTTVSVSLGIVVGVGAMVAIPSLRIAATSAISTSGPTVITEAMATVTSNPLGAQVLIDGK